LDGYGVEKAVEGHRSPRRYRASASFLWFMFRRRNPETMEAAGFAGNGRLDLYRQRDGRRHFV
jgi:hypothetical protein